MTDEITQLRAQIADLQRQLAEARESDASDAATQFLYKHGDLTYTAAHNAIALLKSNGFRILSALKGTP